MCVVLLFFICPGTHQVLTVLPNSFPTRRSSVLSNGPMTALSQFDGSIALPYFSRIERPADGLPQVVSFAWAGALPAGAVLALLSAPVIEILYGARWLPAAAVLAALGLYGGLRVVFDVFAGYIYSQGRSRSEAQKYELQSLMRISY